MSPKLITGEIKKSIKVASDEILAKPVVMSRMSADFGGSCNLCGMLSASRQALAVPRALRRRQLRVARAYVDDAHTCTACMMRFSNYTRLIDHLSEKRLVCLVNVLLRQDPVPLDVSAALQAEAKLGEQAQRRALRRHSFGREAAVQAYGPLNKLFIPRGTYRGSRHPLLQVALQSALEIDVSTCVSAELEAGSDLHLHGVDDDNLPLAIACWKACLHVEVP